MNDTERLQARLEDDMETTRFHETPPAPPTRETTPSEPMDAMIPEAKTPMSDAARLTRPWPMPRTIAMLAIMFVPLAVWLVHEPGACIPGILSLVDFVLILVLWSTGRPYGSMPADLERAWHVEALRIRRDPASGRLRALVARRGRTMECTLIVRGLRAWLVEDDGRVLRREEDW